ncbi:hypothetical protein SAMN05443572_114164 [Myxococcus fulvus]|uniref:Uncharacterized protein n=1 Tax=Myxococcus fulvus TaxID=33 RepID=A0A511TAW8_MYXFU|nr:hypothetical protein [Myxococcus fulvus]GEN11315.1 hypothetical protein MFU01_63520 [Myxococcus fulvus]SEU39707.1 hypothetical protein SAMN05443572_114164 [Myxococcus fulvus]
MARNDGGGLGPMYQREMEELKERLRKAHEESLAAIAKLSQHMDRTRVNLDALDRSHADFRQSFQAVQREYGELRELVHEHHVAIGETRQEVSGLKGDVTGLKGDVAGLKGDVGVLKQDVKEIRLDVHELKQDVILLKQKVETLEVKVISLERKMEAVHERLDGIDRRLDSMDKRIDAIDSRLGIMESGYQAIEVKLQRSDRLYEEMNERMDLFSRDLRLVRAGFEESVETLAKLAATMGINASEMRRGLFHVNEKVARLSVEQDTTDKRLQAHESILTRLLKN